MGFVSALPPIDTARNLYARNLERAYRLPFRIPDPSFSLARDIDAYEKVKTHAIAAHVIEHRRHLVAGTSWSVEPDSDRPEDKRLASVQEEVFREIQSFDSARFNLSEAVFTGSRFAFERWALRLSRFGDGVPRRWWVCDRLQDVDRLRVRLASNTDRARGEPVRVHMEVYSVQRGSWVKVTRPEQFVVHVYDDAETNLGYGRGILDAMYVTISAMEEVEKQGLQGLARWSRGYLIAKIDGMRNASTGKPNETQAQAWLDYFDNTQSQHGTVIDKSDDLQNLLGPGQGHEMVQAWLDRCENRIYVLGLGSKLPTGGGSDGGSYAMASVQESSTDALVRYDRSLLGASLTRALMPQFMALNRRNIEAMGLGKARSGRFSIGQETVENPTEAAPVAAQLLSAGVPLKKEEVYRKTGYTMPAEGDEVFQGATANGLGALGLGAGGSLPSGAEIDAMLRGEGPDTPPAPVGDGEGGSAAA